MNIKIIEKQLLKILKKNIEKYINTSTLKCESILEGNAIELRNNLYMALIMYIRKII